MESEKKPFDIVKVVLIFGIILIVALVITAVALVIMKQSSKDDVIEEPEKEEEEPITPIENEEPEKEVNLEVEEHVIVIQGEDTPDHVSFKDRISKEILDERAEWRKEVIESSNLSSAEDDPYINTLNEELKEFNYEIVRNYSPPTDIPNKAYYNLKYYDNVVAANLSFIRNYKKYKDNGNFSLSAEQTVDEVTKKDITFYKGEILEWDPIHLVDSIIVNDELLEVVKVEVKEKITTDDKGVAKIEEAKTKYVIKTKKKEVFSFVPEIDYDTIQTFIEYDNHWILEYRQNEEINVVISDGISIGKNNQYEDIFNYTLIKGKPFYFFKKDGKIKISYDNKVLENEYDEIIHNKCCEATIFNPMTNGSMIWFYALKDGNWVYVEAGDFSSDQ